LLAALLFPSALRAAPIVVSADKESGVYAVGETVKWSVEWKGDGSPPSPAHYTLKSGGLKEVGQGDLSFAGNVAKLETKFDAPGTMLLEVKWQPDTPANRAFGGAVAAPERIMPAAEPPADFEAFWKSKIEQLTKIPPNPRLERAGDGGKPGVEYSKITLDNIRGTHINGQIARPAKGEKFPALLIVQWAGVYPLQKPWVTDRAAEGWLALNILPHDLPIDEPEQFYKDQFAGPLKNYWAIGNDDRDTSYYLRMYLSCVRALEYLKSRPDWNGKTLVVMGASQGGQQTLMTAGLCADSVTAALPFLPAACDMLAPEVGRASGFPFWSTQVHDGKDPAKIREASRYYDPINFARKIKCPILIGLGLSDDLAPPSSVLAAANVIAAPKEVIILAKAGHQDENGSQRSYGDRAYGAWLPALRDGKPPPIATAATTAATTATTATPTTASASAAASEQDHRRMMELLKIDKLRRGADAKKDSPYAQNSDESKATPYPNLPDPLRLENGQAATTPQMWWKQRRPEIVELFDREIYGRVPANLPAVKWELVATSDEIVGGVAVVTKQLIGHVDNSAYPAISVDIRMTLTTPARATSPVPVMMEFSFAGPRGAATRPQSSTRPREPGPTWQEQVIARGWGYATLSPTSIQADNGAGLTQGIIGLANRGQPRKADDWGSLRAWAWGASRALDYLQTDKSIDAKHVGIEGLSRYGKAALVTMAYDPRFAIAFVASSGAGGAKLFRRDFGERVENLAASGEYHWMAGNFLKYAGPLTPGDLPVDAHELIAVCAPRPVFISAGSLAVEGTWIDARGMFLATAHAGPVYRLLGKKDLGTTEFPPMETALIDGDLAFRQHSGGHTAGPNWPTFLKFAERYMNNGATPVPAGATSATPAINERLADQHGKTHRRHHGRWVALVE
jgi:(4-O-methyl)-D-glucuronate---lignin esterase